MVEICNKVANINLKSVKNIAFKMCKEGKSFEGYVDFLEQRIKKETDFSSANPDVIKTFRYRDLTPEQITYLKKFFKIIETNMNNANAKNYEDILFRHKQKKNYNEKKNALIDEWRIKKIDELDSIPKNEKNALIRSRLFNEIYMYNKVVPKSYSRESLRKVVLTA